MGRVPVRGCQTPVGYSSVYPYVGVQSSAGVFKTQQDEEGIRAVLWPGVGCWNSNRVGGPPALGEAVEMGD